MDVSEKRRKARGNGSLSEVNNAIAQGSSRYATHIQDEAVKQANKERDEIRESYNQIKREVDDIKETALIADMDGTVVYDPAGVRLSPHTGLAMPDEMERDDYDAVASILFSMEDAIQLAIGDFILWGMEKYSLDVAHFANQYNRDYDTIQDYVRVSKSIDKTLRRGGLYISHYKLVASDRFTYKQKEALLDKAVSDNMTVQAFAEHIRGQGDGSLPSTMDNAIRRWSATSTWLHNVWDDLGVEEQRQMLVAMQDFIDKHKSTTP